MRNSFSGKILLTVSSGILVLAIAVSAMVISMSKQAFTDTYGRSQEQVFQQIENELNSFHTDLQRMIEAVDSSGAFRLYLANDAPLTNVQNFQNIYQMEYDLNMGKTPAMDRLNILVMGVNGKNYLSRTETIVVDEADIMESHAVKKAFQEPEHIHYTYARGGFTATSRENPVIIASKALFFRESGEVYGVILVTLGMEDMEDYYDYFVSENTDWYLVDDEKAVICSNQQAEIGQRMEEPWFENTSDTLQGRMVIWEHGKNLTVMRREMPYFNSSMYGVIDNNVALDGLYNVPLLVLGCASVGICVLCSCMFIVRAALRPLSNLIDKMSHSRKEEFREYVAVEGAYEVQQLAVTYNEMLDDIQNYILELMQMQEAQRKAEIKALQMQINPHYIYNTLASIKWLIYQNDLEKTTETIDAFISLLRNTISNMDEMISVEQELVNLENYVLINHTRYGFRIQVEYEIDADSYECRIPKMILQPFIENAFFHAFPSDTEGTIYIGMRTTDNCLVITIKDNGIGMENMAVDVMEGSKKEHFSGIGIGNVQERLRLLFGADYDIRIESESGKGTSVFITLPKVYGEPGKE